MNTRSFLTLGALAATLALPVAAAAKGPSAARLEGPGLKTALSFARDGEAGPGTPLGSLTQAAGFFPAMFGQSPDPMLRVRLKGNLGPRYTITWVVPGPNADSILRQDVYPYAEPVPLTYMRPGQPFWDGQQTYGGWYRAAPTLRQTLVAAGLPTKAPSTGSGSALSSAWLLAAIAAAGAILLGALGALALRRRGRAPAVA